MKINSIKLVGFRSHVKTVVAGLSKVNIFVGKNGVGKSTILDAIAYALTGVTRGVDEGGRGAEALVCQIPGAPKTSTTVTLATDKGEILRGMGQGPRSQAHLKIVTKLGLDDRILRVLAAPLNLLRLPAKKQEEVFFSLTGSTVTTDLILNILVKAGIDLDATPVDLDELLSPEARASKLAFWKEKRVEFKREIQTLVFTPSEKELPAANEEQRLALVEEHANLNQEIAKTGGAQESAKRLIEHFDELIADAAASVQNLEKIQNKKLTSPADLKKWRAAIEECTSSREKVAAKIGEFTAASKEKARLQAEAERIKKLGDECAQCGQPISKAAGEKKIKAMRGDFTAASKKCLDLSKEIAALGDAIAKIDVNALLEQINGADRVVEDNERNAAALDKAKKDLAGYQAKRDEIEVPQAADTAALEARRAEIVDQVALLVEAEAEEGRQKSVNARRSEIEENLALLEIMLKVVGPGGELQAAMAAGGTEEMVAQVREIGAALGVGDIGVKFGPWQITLNGRNVELASASEEFRVAAAFGIAFAKKAGASLVLLDGAEILRGDNRGLFQDLLFASGLEQVFVAFASDSVPESIEEQDGLSMFHVEKDESGASSVTAIKQAAAAA